MYKILEHKQDLKEKPFFKVSNQRLLIFFFLFCHENNVVDKYNLTKGRNDWLLQMLLFLIHLSIYGKVVHACKD